MNDSSVLASRLKSVAALGQQVWLTQAVTGLADWIAEDGIAGLACAPADIASACERLQHGFVCLAVPYVDDAAALADLARARWHAVGRPNCMISLPASEAGIAALEELTHAGIPTQMTLVFTTRQLSAVRAAYRRGLARRLEAKLSVQRIASVASVAVDRLDAAVDALLPASAGHLRGQAAIAAARVAYHAWQQDPHFGVFAAFGAMPQRLMWTSSGARAPTYLEELIGPDTIHAAPAEALAIFRLHGQVRPSLQERAAESQKFLAQLARHGIDLETIGQSLLAAGTISGFSGATP